MQVSQGTSKVVCYSHLFKNFHRFFVIHTVKVFSIVSEAEEDVFFFFFEILCFLYDLTDIDNLIFGFSDFSKSSYIWKFSVHVLLKPSLKDFEHSLLACKMNTIIW